MGKSPTSAPISEDGCSSSKEQLHKTAVNPKTDIVSTTPLSTPNGSCSCDTSNKCKNFVDTFDFLMNDIFSENECSNNRNEISETVEFKEEMKETWGWLKTVMFYNVPKGKHFRGRLVEQAYKGLVRDASEEMLKLARILGWAVEILQACYLVADDIMDGGQLRRAQPCWHRVDNKGLLALNDSFLLEHAAYQVLHKYFRHLPCYTDLVDLCLGITFKTIMGQSLDTRTSLGKSFQENNQEAEAADNSQDDNNDPFECYNIDLYKSIVRYKTSFYTCYLPVALAMCLANIPRKNGRLPMWNNVEKVTLEIGHLFQVQDDYFDCFGDERIIGKTGVDIQEGKCTWLFVEAKNTLKKLGDHDKYKVLKENYGRGEPACVQQVKQIYTELEIPIKLQNYQEQVVRNIIELIRRLNHSGLEDVLTYFFDLIYKRTY